MQEFNKHSQFVSDTGGLLDFVSTDGEILASVAVPSGIVSCSSYLSLVPDGAHIQVSSGLSVLNPRSAAGIQPYGDGSHDTGANPDFRPLGSADRLQREMAQTLRSIQASSKRLEARERALATVQRIPTAPVAAPPVPEPEPAPEPLLE